MTRLLENELERIKDILLTMVSCARVHGENHFVCDTNCGCLCKKEYSFQPKPEKPSEARLLMETHIAVFHNGTVCSHLGCYPSKCTQSPRVDEVEEKIMEILRFDKSAVTKAVLPVTWLGDRLHELVNLARRGNRG